MSDVIGLLLGVLAAVLGGAALALGGQVIREAWRDVFKVAHPHAAALKEEERRRAAGGANTAGRASE